MLLLLKGEEVKKIKNKNHIHDYTMVTKEEQILKGIAFRREI